MKVFDNSNRDYAEYLGSMRDFVARRHPALAQAFSDGDVGQALLEIAAGMLSHVSLQADHALADSLLGHTTQRRVLFDLAAAHGLHVPTASRSAAVLDVTVQVPAAGTGFSSAMLPRLAPGATFRSPGSVFTVEEAVDFSSDYGPDGKPDRTYVPVMNGNAVAAYRVTKRVGALSGERRTARFTVAATEPFTAFRLPDAGVSSVEGVNVLKSASEALSSANRWDAVESLSQGWVYRDGAWERTERRYVAEHAHDGSVWVRFGGSSGMESDVKSYVRSGGAASGMLELAHAGRHTGLMPEAGDVVVVSYRTCGGSADNVPAGTITTIGTVKVEGVAPDESARILRSMECSNPLPACGGRDVPGDEEVRAAAAYHRRWAGMLLSARDYEHAAINMAGGGPAPTSARAVPMEGGVRLYVHSRGASGASLSDVSPMLPRVQGYLSGLLPMGVRLEVEAARVVTVRLEVEVMPRDNASADALRSSLLPALQVRCREEGGTIGRGMRMGELYRLLVGVEEVAYVGRVAAYGQDGLEIPAGAGGRLQCQPDQVQEVPEDGITLKIARNPW